MNKAIRTALALSLATMLLASAGCQDDAVSRTVTTEEVQQSNERRAEYIDTLNIPDSQKQAMKDRLGQPKGETDTRGTGN